MKDLFVPYDLAKKLKEKGFNHECYAFYENTGKLVFSGLPGYNRLRDEFPNMAEFTSCAPLWQQVISWIIEQGLYVLVDANHSGWYWEICKTNGTHVKSRDDYYYYKSYQSALEDGILKALELI
jgi:hypothetical protein